jgi:hypothetical protein
MGVARRRCKPRERAHECSFLGICGPYGEISRMTMSKARDSEHNKELKLPRRDYIVLPLLSVLTIFLIAGSTELIARRLLPMSEKLGEACMVFNDPSTGTRGIPNSVCWDKLPDTERTEYRFNGCGHRTNLACGPKPAGTYRIVMVGSSLATGMRLPIEKTFATLLPAELSRRTGRKIDIYNEGMPWRSPAIIETHFKDILTPQPDMILWIVTPLDIGEGTHLLNQVAAQRAEASDLPAPGKTSFWALAKQRLKVGLDSASRAVQDLKQRQRTGSLLKYFLYQSQSQYLKAYLMRGSDTEFLKTNPDPEWHHYMKQFEGSAAQMEAQARAVDVPLVVVLLPIRAQAAMISMGGWPTGYDPFKLDNDLRTIIANCGGTYLDILPDFRKISDSEKDYFPIDTHLNAAGNALISSLLAREITSGAIPELRVTPTTAIALRDNK